MSEYTTELRFICESKAGCMQSVGYNSINDVLRKAAPQIFNFDYPIFDELYRLPLEMKILRHYYTREISEETVGLWQLRLEDKMNEIMPYYNQLYDSARLRFNPFHDTDYKFIHQGKSDSNKKQNTTSINKNNRDLWGTNDEGYTENEKYKQVDNTGVTEGEHTTDDFNKTVDNTGDKQYNVDNSNTGLYKTNDKTETVENEDNIYTDHIDHTEDNKYWTKGNVTEDNGEITDHSVDNDNKYTIDKTLIERVDGHTTEDNTITTSTTENKKKIDTPNLTTTRDGYEQMNETQWQDDVNKYSDTPQGTLENVKNGTYLTNATVIDNEDVTDRHTDTHSTEVRTGTDTTTENNGEVKKQVDDKNKVTDDTTTTTDEQHNADDKKETGHKEVNEDKDKNYTETKTDTIDKDTDERKVDDINKTGNEVFTGLKDNKDTILKDEHTHTTENEVTHSFDDKNRALTNNKDYTSDHTKDNAHNKNIVIHNSGIITDDNKGTLNYDIYNTDAYINRIVGNRGYKNFSKLLQDFRATFLNIDREVIRELEVLFFMLY